jgi:hypothetical protein
LCFEIYHPKNNVHNQDGNHDDNKVRITIFFFFELTDNDGQNFLAGIVHEFNKDDFDRRLELRIETEIAQTLKP